VSDQPLEEETLLLTRLSEPLLKSLMEAIAQKGGLATEISEAEMPLANIAYQQIHKHYIVNVIIAPKSNITTGGKIQTEEYRMSERDNRIQARDIISSAVGSDIRFRARDITVYQRDIDQSTVLDPELKQKLKEAREALDKVDLSEDDKNDVADNLEKLTIELEKPQRDAGRVKRFWNRIKEVAPTVAAILSTAASIAKLVSGG
jgi:hypothetical protein